MNRPLLAGAAAAVVMFIAGACGDSGGTSNTGCTTDADCADSTKMCHPTLKSCVTACTSSSDCPSSAKTCATLSGASANADAGVKAFCQCSTDQLCNGSGSTDQVCQSTTSKVCTKKCTSNSDCGGSSCDTATGKCGSSSSDGGTTDAGTVDAGTIDAGMAIDAGVACTSTNDQPDVCGYGNACTTANTCEAQPDGTCSNIANAKNPQNPSAARPAFNPATSTGPIIFNVDASTADDPGACGGGASDNPRTVTVYAYAGPNFTFQSSRTALPGFWYFRTTGAVVDAIPLFNPSASGNFVVSGGGKIAAIRVTICGGAATGDLSLGFGFTNGNAVCVNTTR